MGMNFSEKIEEYYKKYSNDVLNCDLIKFYNHTKGPQTLSWVGTDTEKRFRANKRNKLSEQQRDTINYYTKNPITYKINGHGFRDVSLKHKPKQVDVFLGCSHTFGVGLHKEHLWTTKLANYTKFPSINAGIPGSGIMTQFRIIKYLLDRFEIRKVYHYSILEHIRYEWFNGEEFFSTGLYTPGIIDIEKYAPLWAEENLALQKYVYFNAIKSLCESAGTEYIPFTDQVLGIYLSKDEDFEDKYLLARDLTHHAVDKHHQVFKNCITLSKTDRPKIKTFI